MSWPQQQQQQNGVFPGMLDASNQQNMFDPSMTQMYNGQGINPSQFTNPHMRQGMPNGGMPQQNAFPNQTYNVGQVIPSKRTSDGMAMSPGPPQNNTINTSRSQTPMQPGTPFQGQPGQQFPNPYQHLQQSGSANASPSPTIQNQQFRQPQPPQRMTSQSPANFNQMPHSTPGQMSPAPNQQHNMSMSPQAQQQNFSPNLTGGAGFGQPFPNQGMMAQGMQGGMNNMNPANMNQTAIMQAQLRQRQYQARMLQQQQSLQANAAMAGGQRQMSGPMGTPMGGQMPGQMPGQMGQQFNAGMQPGQGMANGQQPGQQQQQQQPGQAGQSQQEKARQWLMTLQQQLQAQGKPFNANPQIGSKPINLYIIWACILGMGGSGRIDANNGWAQAAQKVGAGADPNAAGQLKQAFQMYLSGYERQFMATKQAQRQQQAQMNARQMAGMGGPQQSPTRPQQGTPQDGQQNNFVQQQPGQQLGMPNQMQQQPNQLQRPSALQMQNGMSVPGMPGPMTPQMDPNQHKRAVSVKQDSVPPQSATESSPVPGFKPASKSIKRENSMAETTAKPDETEWIVTCHKPFDSMYGGYEIKSLVDQTTNIALLAQESIRVQTMFIADVRALTLSLQSGIPSEERYAIDTLADLSSKPVYWKDPRMPQPVPGVMILDKCEDLLDSILDTLDEHIEILSDDTAEVTDGIEMVSYENLLRLARLEQESLRDVPEPGSAAYTLEHAADRLVALLQILSNLSMDQFNHNQLSSREVVSMLANTLRLIGTRQLFLRTYENTMDFYKIAVTFLSNIAGPKLELPTRDDALHILHFLLTFAPQPPPSISEAITTGKPIHFSPYTPSLHRYTPAAIDTLAKLLARQEPNRTFYRSIFNSSSPDHSAEDIFTRAFALSISFLPDRSKGPLLGEQELALLKLRKAYLGQGMLAADILASLLPSPNTSQSQNQTNGDAQADVNLAKIWLESTSNWPAALLRMALLLATNPRVNENLLPPQERPVRRDMNGQVVRGRDHSVLFDEGNDVPSITAVRGLGMLRKLVERVGLETRKGMNKERGEEGQKVNGAHPDEEGEELRGNGEADGDVGREEKETGDDRNGKEDRDGEDSEEEGVLVIKGDPLPRRETITALLGTGHPVDTEALRQMDRLYDLIMPRG
ncbi:ARid/BRIGHT DNA-binding domain-containing protein 1 [Elsinoe fawcettii]|nr:ARid/BRIGHT DNA-binding domain-containing protein 1 [Elsinoe fawcettii]